MSRTPNFAGFSMKAGLLLLSGFLVGTAQAETRRALLVGIDHYIRPGTARASVVTGKTKERLAQVHGRPSRSGISDLEGAVNDAIQLREILIRKYKFEARNIILLKDDEATADRILDTLQTHLVDAAKPGDISFFYYAGHGSRIRNTLTKNLSGMDSTLVPADTLLGAPDIRSKELASIYLQARRNNVELTVVEDSCFSGAGIRGPRPMGRTRGLDADSKVFVAEALQGPLPEEQGVLFFSASQDYQPAQELEDDRLGKHGAFTWAFLQVLATAGENERVDRIFQRTRALMQSKVNDQEPVVLQSAGRNERGLFGQAADPFGAATAAVGFIQPAQMMLELNSGVTMGLSPGSELKRISPTDPPVRIRITEVNGPSSSNAVPLEPSKITAIAPGDLFQLDKLVVPDKEFLKVYVGDTVPFSQLAPIVRLAADLRAGGRIELVDDPTESTPTYVLLWDGDQKRWMLTENRLNGVVFTTAQLPSSTDVTRALTARNLKPRLAIILPAPAELVSNLAFTSNGNIVSFTRALQNADYFLMGRATSDGSIEYSWARPSVTQEDLRNQHEAARRQKYSISLSGWPLRSDWQTLNGPTSLSAAGSRLTQQGLDLARIVGWMQLQTPIPDDSFPYGIALRDEKNGQLSDGELTGKRTYKVSLRRDPLSQQTSVAPRRVYIFVVDSYGKGTLVFGTNLDNEFPRKHIGKLPDEIDLNAKVEITAPYGTDNYFLLTSAQPIDNPEAIFNFAGVRTRGLRLGGPLEKLIESHEAGTRGALSGVPTNWSIERTPFRSKDPNQ